MKKKNSIFFCFLILLSSEPNRFHQDLTKVMTETWLMAGSSLDTVQAMMLFVPRCQQRWAGVGVGVPSSLWRQQQQLRVHSQHNKEQCWELLLAYCSSSSLLAWAQNCNLAPNYCLIGCTLRNDMILLCFSSSIFLSEDQLQPHRCVFIHAHQLTRGVIACQLMKKGFN